MNADNPYAISVTYPPSALVRVTRAARAAAEIAGDADATQEAYFTLIASGERDRLPPEVLLAVRLFERRATLRGQLTFLQDAALADAHHQGRKHA